MEPNLPPPHWSFRWARHASPLIVGLIPVALSATGFVLWQHRQWDRARRRESLRQAKRLQS